jgi:hypothetical protein
MFTIVKSTKIVIIRHILFVASLFILLILTLDNKTTLVLNITNTNNTKLQAEFYYTLHGENFSEEKKKSVDRINGNLYYFTLPKSKYFDHIRLDPAKSKQNISIIKNGHIITSKWFKDTIYKIDITKSKPANQINHYEVTTQGINFTTIANDPQLSLNLERKLLFTSINYHLDTFILALFIYLIIFFLIMLNKTSKKDPDIINKLILYSLFLINSFLAPLKYIFYVVPKPPSKKNLHFLSPS